MRLGTRAVWVSIAILLPVQVAGSVVLGNVGNRDRHQRPAKAANGAVAPAAPVPLDLTSALSALPDLSPPPSAPREDSAQLLTDQPPTGFVLLAGSPSPVTIDLLAAASPNPATARDALNRLGLRQGVSRSWVNRSRHQFVTAVVTEWRSPGAAAERKLGEETVSLTKEHGQRIPLSDAPGAVTVHRDSKLADGKPESVYTETYRVDRWLFDVAVGAVAGLPGSTAPTVAQLSAVVAVQYSKAQVVLSRYLTTAAQAGRLTFTDPNCGCSVTLPASWDVRPFDAELTKADFERGAAAIGADASTPPFDSIGNLLSKLAPSALFDVDNSGVHLVLALKIPVVAPLNDITPFISILAPSANVDSQQPVTVGGFAGQQVRLQMTANGTSITEKIDLVPHDHATYVLVVAAGGNGMTDQFVSNIENSFSVGTAG